MAVGTSTIPESQRSGDIEVTVYYTLGGFLVAHGDILDPDQQRPYFVDMATIRHGVRGLLSRAGVSLP
jgi:hypothetical protein